MFHVDEMSSISLQKHVIRAFQVQPFMHSSMQSIMESISLVQVNI